MIIRSEDAEGEAVLHVARLMVAAARTAPKAGGRDNIKCLILTGEEKDRLADAMGPEPEFNSRNVKDAGAIVLIGVDFGSPVEEWMNFKGKLIDLGIALGSAVKIASDLNVDNRIMWSAGRAAIKTGVMKADEVQGIPIAIKGKNIFFDRYDPIIRGERKSQLRNDK